MGAIRPKPAVLLFLAAFSRFESLLDRTRELIGEHFSPVALASNRYDFVETDYYEREMGPGLHKQLFACERPIAADELPAIKLRTNALEAEIPKSGDFALARPLNLDPGYLDLGKVVMASTKDHVHRLYLGQGIFGEVTLRFDRKTHQWQPNPWTYPDYRREEVREFFGLAREYYRGMRNAECETRDGSNRTIPASGAQSFLLDRREKV